MDRSWPLLPKQWMLPQLFQDFHLPEMKDSLMLGLQEEKDKMEVTLDTSGYKPDELKVEIKGGELCVEGKHEEQRIEEVERGSTPIQVDHVRSSAERKTEEVSSREKKARTSPTKAGWTTLKALGRCRGGGEVFPRRAGRGTRAEPGRRSPALSTPRRTKRVRPQAQGAQAGAVRWWWKGKRNEGRGGEAGPGTSKSL